MSNGTEADGGLRRGRKNGETMHVKVIDKTLIVLIWNKANNVIRRKIRTTTMQVCLIAQHTFNCTGIAVDSLKRILNQSMSSGAPDAEASNKFAAAAAPSAVASMLIAATSGAVTGPVTPMVR